MVTVRHSHSEDEQTFVFDSWFEHLKLSDRSRQKAVDFTYLYCEELALKDPKLLVVCREMTEILATLNMDSDTLMAAMLYPFWQNKLLNPQTLEKDFGFEVLKLVLAIDKMDAIRCLQAKASKRLENDQVDNVRRMLLAMVEDVRAIVIKLAVCIIDLRSARHADEETRVLTAKEASTIYAPLANRLGIGQLKWEIEDFSFRFLHPQTYKQIARLLKEKRTEREHYIDDFVTSLQSKLDNMNIKGEVVGRPKHIYSIWKKMQHKNLTLDSIFDIRAVRVLVESLPECYASLGAVHTSWTAISKEFSDYIATPKANGYQSIHTIVLGPEGKAIEVQIRTRQMHHDAELGVAAHWRYKEGSTTGKLDSSHEKINWLRKLLQWQEDVSDSSELVDELRSQVFEERVYVFSPKGEVIDLPNGSTPLDFAYYIHSNIGHCCIGAKVFGKIVPFTYTLQSADQVEILTSKTPNPSRDWLNPQLAYLKSTRARSKVQYWFKQQDKDKNRELGREAIEKELARLELHSDELTSAITRFNMNNLDDLYSTVGGGDLSLKQLFNFIQSLHKKDDDELDPRTFKRSTASAKRQQNDDGIVVEGVGNLMTYFAKCCQPVQGDVIQGYITQGKGIAVHRQDCEQLANQLKQNPEREVDVAWGSGKSHGYRVSVRVSAHDRNGLLKDITTLLVNEKASVHAVNSLTNDNTLEADINLDLEVDDNSVLERILSSLVQVNGVFDAKRSR